MKWVLPAVLACIVYGCFNLDDCKPKECVSPPPDILFMIADKKTGENLFENGTLTGDTLFVTDENNKQVACKLVTDNGYYLVSIPNIGWLTGTHKYTLTAGRKLHIPFTLTMKTRETKCCTYFEIQEFTVSNYEYEGDTLTGYVKVLIDTSTLDK